MAFWLTYRIKRFFIRILGGRCLGEFLLHCWHHQSCKVPEDRHCFVKRAEGEYVEGYLYQCCRCQIKTNPKKVKHYSGY